MAELADFLAVDLGASGGRVLLGRWDGNAFDLQEVHRFPNGPVAVLGHLHWDVLRLWGEIQAGLARYGTRVDGHLAGIGLDTWGVDLGLLDGAGRLLGNPYHYRDSRTNGVLERAFRRVPRREIFEQTGIQFIQFNTLFQLFSMLETAEPQLAAAEDMLMMPDLFHYWLTGRKVAEYTIASTSQMLDARTRCWAAALLDRLGISERLLPEIVSPGTILGPTRAEVVDEACLHATVPVIAVGSHDTASAVAAIPDLDADSAYISSGTWSLIGMEVPEPIINDQALALNFTNEGGVANTIRLLKNVTGLWLLQESRRQWQREGHDLSWDQLLARAAQAEPFHSLIDPDAPDFMAPSDMPATIRAYCRRVGQPEPDSVGAVVRCCLESVALKSRWVISSVATLAGRQPKVVRIVGGGCQNRMLCQFTADACELPVLAGPVEATAMGNLMVQAIAIGYLPDVAAGRRAVGASARRETYEPQNAPAWRDAYARFTRLLEA